MRALLLALALTFAGCLSGTQDASTVPAPSPPMGELTPLPVEELWVTGTDGAEIHAAVFRPDTTEPVPVVVDLSPYWWNLKPGNVDGGEGFAEHMLEYLVPRGYAVALASVRGTGYSGGCMDLGGPLEMADSVALVRDLATQPWSNGRVALVGKSYDGTTPAYAAVAGAHEAGLRTIVTISGISDWYRYLYNNGLPYSHGPIFNLYYMLGVGWSTYGDPSQDADRRAEDICYDFAEGQAHGFGSGITGDKTEYWKIRDYKASADAVEVPVFLVHGLQDWNVKPDHVMGWFNELDVPKLAWLGQWEHKYPNRVDWMPTLEAWLGAWLRDQALPWSLPRVEAEDTDEKWRLDTAYPPTNATLQTLYLSADGALLPSPGDGTVTIGPGEPARFSTEPLPADTRLTAAPTLHLRTRALTPRAGIEVHLLDGANRINWGVMSLNHAGADEGTPMVPLEERSFIVDLFPLEHTVRAGERIVVEVTVDADQVVMPPTRLDLVLGQDAYLEFPTLSHVMLLDPQPEEIEVDEVPGN